MTEKLISIEKIDLSEKDKESAMGELEHIQRILRDLADGDAEGDKSVAYADTGEAMSILDSILGGDPAYDTRLALRKEASKKSMQGTDEEKMQGYRDTMMWVQQIKGLI